MWWTSRKLRMIERLIPRYNDIISLFNKLQFHFTTEERIMFVTKSLRAENSDDEFIRILRSI